MLGNTYDLDAADFAKLRRDTADLSSPAGLVTR